MKTSSLYRQVPGLLAGIVVFVNCFLFSGCNLVQTKTLFGPDLRQFPAVVLTVTSHEYTFDWDKTTIGGAPVSEFVPRAKFWRLGVFKFSDGVRIGGTDGDFHAFEVKRSEVFHDLPWDKLLRADLDLTDDPNGDKEAKTLSFIVLLHNE